MNFSITQNGKELNVDQSELDTIKYLNCVWPTPYECVWDTPYECVHNDTSFELNEAQIKAIKNLI